MDNLLFHLNNALKEEAIKTLKHATGYEPRFSDSQIYRTSETNPGEYPFGSMFQLRCFGPKGETTYTVSISEANS